MSESLPSRGVQVVSSMYGMTLVFATKRDLELMIDHLEGQLAFAEQNDIPAPYLYAISVNFDDYSSQAEYLAYWDAYLDFLKERMAPPEGIVEGE